VLLLLHSFFSFRIYVVCREFHPVEDASPVENRKRRSVPLNPMEIYIAEEHSVMNDNPVHDVSEWRSPVKEVENNVINSNLSN
jgi:hypothetical protein